jgi:preprotein translocase subunit SecG
MTTFITVVHLVTCFFVVLVVLMQSGKGAEISATLGGSSQTVFGSAGGANFFQKITYVLAGLFMVTSLLLTVVGSHGQKSVFDRVGLTSTPPGAAAPAAGTAAKTPDTGAAPAATK